MLREGQPKPGVRTVSIASRTCDGSAARVHHLGAGRNGAVVGIVEPALGQRHRRRRPLAAARPVRRVGERHFRIELVEHSGYLGFHHVHLSSPEPAETLTWYQNVFGGDRTRLLDRLDAVLYGNVWLLASEAREPVAATEGRAIDHLGFSFPNLDTAAANMKRKGVEFTMEPREITSTVAAKIAVACRCPQEVREFQYDPES